VSSFEIFQKQFFFEILINLFKSFKRIKFLLPISNWCAYNSSISLLCAIVDAFIRLISYQTCVFCYPLTYLRADLLASQYQGHAQYPPCHYRGHGEDRRLRTCRIATWLLQLCSVRRVIAQRHTSSTCAERCCSGSRLGFQAAINKLALPTGTVTLVADRVASPV